MAAGSGVAVGIALYSSSGSGVGADSCSAVAAAGFGSAVGGRASATAAQFGRTGASLTGMPASNSSLYIRQFNTDPLPALLRKLVLYLAPLEPGKGSMRGN